MMVSNVLYNPVNTFIIVVTVSTVTSTVSGGTCEACNCQFNNIELLDQLIESKVASQIASGKLHVPTTVMKLQWISMVCIWISDKQGCPKIFIHVLQYSIAKVLLINSKMAIYMISKHRQEG